MALLFDGRIRVTTAANVPISGGKLRVYNAGTTTLTTIYSDAALSVPLSNPVVAGSDGLCVQIFAAEGTTVDMQTETAAGVVLKTYEDVVFVGAESTTFSRDFTASRVQIRNDGGVVQVETGNASGDDVGGSGRYGGWNGTQGDAAEFDYAVSTFTGKMLVNDTKHIQGVVVSEGSFSASSAVTIALPQTPYSSVRTWDLELIDVENAAVGGSIYAYFAFDSVPTFLTTANYDYGLSKNAVYGATTGSVRIVLTSLVGGSTKIPLHGQYRIRSPNTGSGKTQISGVTTLETSIEHVSALYKVDEPVATYIQLVPNSGTLTGRYRLTVPLGLGET